MDIRLPNPKSSEPSPRTWQPRGRVFALAMLIATVLGSLSSRQFSRHQVMAETVPSGELVNPLPASGTGDDPPPEYITGDECLFCHRFETGNSWQRNRHQLTIRPASSESWAIQELASRLELAGVTQTAGYVLGNRNRLRFLRKAPSYGRLEMLSVELAPPREDRPSRLLHTEDPSWQTDLFANSCAGCHTTQVDSRTGEFSALSLDCYVCHGPGSLDHSTDPSRILLARSRKDPPRLVASICAQCHLRGGRSKSTGLPYPNNYVAGTDLFRDFAVDFLRAEDPQLNPGDRHIYGNVRDVLTGEREGVTCLSCHSVHGQSTVRHRRLPDADLCLICHNAEGRKSEREPYEVHSPVCGY